MAIGDGRRKTGGARDAGDETAGVLIADIALRPDEAGRRRIDKVKAEWVKAHGLPRAGEDP